MAQFLTIPILGALSDRYGRRPVLHIGIAGEVLGCIVLGAATSLPMLYISRLIAGASSGNIGAAQASGARPKSMTMPRTLGGRAPRPNCHQKFGRLRLVPRAACRPNF